MVSIGTLFAFVVSVAVIVLRHTDPDTERPFRAPWVPVLTAVAILACLGLMANWPCPPVSGWWSAASSTTPGW